MGLLGASCLVSVLLAAALSPASGTPPTQPPPAQTLLGAVKEHQTEVSLEMIRHGADLDLQDSDGRTALMLAAMLNQTEVGLEMIQHGADLDLQDEHGQTALMWAVHFNQTEVGLEIIQRGANLDLQDQHGYTALMWAVWPNQTAIGMEIIQHGANLDLQDKHGQTALMWAVSSNQTEVGLEMIQRGANLDLQDEHGQTALMLAAVSRFNQTEVGLEMIKHGADLDLQDEHGQTALMRAAQSRFNQTEVGLEMIQRGANLDLQDDWGQTALMLAVNWNQIAIGMEIIQRSANLDLQDEHGQTALMYAVMEQRHKDVMNAALSDLVHGNDTSRLIALSAGLTELGLELIKRGASLDLQSGDADMDVMFGSGKTALMLAVTGSSESYHSNYLYGQTNSLTTTPPPELATANAHAAAFTAIENVARSNLAKLALEMIQRGANLDLQDQRGHTALMNAAQFSRINPNNRTTLGLAMIQHGADLDLQDNDGHTALMYAAVWGNIELGRELVSQGADIHKATYVHQRRALHMCMNSELAEVLLDNGAEMDLRDASGRTPLWWAASRGRTDMVKLLLARGASVAIPALWGETPERRATFENHTDLAELLRDDRPSAWALAVELAGRSNTWLHLGLGVLAGVTVAVVVLHRSSRLSPSRYAMMPQDGDAHPAFDAESGKPSKGCRNLAQLAFAKRHGSLRFYATLAQEALGILARLTFPLGVAMLFVKPPFLLAFYAAFYAAPVFVSLGWQQVLNRPFLIFTGPAHGMQVVATIILLAIVKAETWDCRAQIAYYVDGDSSSPHYRGSSIITYPSVLIENIMTKLMVDDGALSLLNAAASKLACPYYTPFILWGSVQAGYLTYLYGLCVLAAAWTILVSLKALVHRCCGCWHGKDQDVALAWKLVGEKIQVEELAKKISHTGTPAEIEQLECDALDVKVKPQSRLMIFKTLAIAFLDMFVLDINTIFNLVLSYNTKFAGALTAVVTASFLMELGTGNFRKIYGDVQVAVATGVMPDSLLEFLENEQGFEAPLSLAITAYTFPFSVIGAPSPSRSWFSLLSGVASMASSVYGAASFARLRADPRAS